MYIPTRTALQNLYPHWHKIGGTKFELNPHPYWQKSVKRLPLGRKCFSEYSAYVHLLDSTLFPEDANYHWEKRDEIHVIQHDLLWIFRG